MLFKALAVAAAAIGGAVAQRPANVSICDYYTTALLKNNTATNQKTLLTLVVNTVVIGNCKSGNYRQPSHQLLLTITRHQAQCWHRRPRHPQSWHL
jgi:hypothetical protein